METLIYDVETDDLLADATTVHCIVMKVLNEPRVGIFVSDENLERANEWAKKDTKFNIVVKRLSTFSFGKSRLICHNQLGFDLRVLRKLLKVAPANVRTQCVDTLVLSRFLNPDRAGGHSLEDWTTHVTGEKVQIEDWKNQPIEKYLERCLEDVEINEKVYLELRAELTDKQLHEPFRLAQFTYYEMVEQELTGVLFDQPAAKQLLAQVTENMACVAREVEPGFGEAPLPQSKQPTFPKRPYKMSGELSATAINYGKKIGITDKGVLRYEINEAIKDPTKRLVLTAPVKLDNLAHVKEYLFSQGWKPTIWRLNDITRDGKRRELTARTIQRAEKYVRDIWGKSPYRELIWDLLNIPPELRVPMGEMDTILFGRARLICQRKGRALPMSPQYCQTVTKALCPNLEKLKGRVVKKILHWMSLRNRRGVLESWLAHSRLSRDGRLPAGSNSIANTHRQRHHTVVNLPSVDAKVVYGKEMRSLFIPPEGMVYVGYDAAGLEARIAGHLAAEFDGGTYAYEVLEGDVHTKNAVAYSEAIGRKVTRKTSKPVTYALMYGASSKKLATMLDCEIHLGDGLVAAFWSANPGLSAAKDKLDQEWIMNGKRFIRSVDGRRIMTRSRHSLLNAAIQSTGAILMDKSWELFCKAAGTLRDDGLWERVLYMHDEYALHVVEYLAKQVGDAGVESIRLAGEAFDVRVPLTGEAKIGPNYAAVH